MEINPDHQKPALCEVRVKLPENSERFEWDNSYLMFTEINGVNKLITVSEAKGEIKQ
jgi:hypothetical protein